VYTITFYSFKGGVGRTLALVNVGAELAKMGRKVLLVDFDLEAPGLETYDRLRPPKPHPGIVEYVTEYERTMQAPDVREYIYPAPVVGKKGGRLWVMPAGRRDANYQAALVNIDWKRLYGERDGFLLFEDMKAQWEQEPELNPDYVLIDSRTGHTDVEGICTRQLADSVVLMFMPNEQNLIGLEGVCRSIRSEATEGLQKTIRLHFVASNVPDLDDESRILDRQMRVYSIRASSPWIVRARDWPTPTSALCRRSSRTTSRIGKGRFHSLRISQNLTQRPDLKTGALHIKNSSLVFPIRSLQMRPPPRFAPPRLRSFTSMMSLLTKSGNVSTMTSRY
jgi:hypothetical protein